MKLKSILCLIAIIVAFSFTTTNNFTNPIYYYKYIRKFGTVEVVKLSNQNRFEYLRTTPGTIDVPYQYSQGVYNKKDSVINFKNSFLDSVPLIVTEKFTKPYNRNPFSILINCSDAKNLQTLSFIGLGEFTDRATDNDLYVCVFNNKGLITYRKYNFEEKNFGYVNCETPPTGFYLKTRSEIVSNIYYIKNKSANAFDINLKLSKDYTPYSYTNNYLYNTNYFISGQCLIDPEAQDTFKLFDKQVNTENVFEVAKMISDKENAP